MYIYIINLLLIWLFGYWFLYKKNDKKVFLICTFTMLALVLGLRGNNVGEDTLHYTAIFRAAYDISWEEILKSPIQMVYFEDIMGRNQDIETSFIILCKVLQLVSDNAQILLLFMAFVTCTSYACFIYENIDDVFLAAYVFMCEFFYMFAFNGSRQLMAIAIGMHAYTFLKKKKIGLALISVLLAAYFHNTSVLFLVMFPIVLLENKRKEWKSFIFVVLACCGMPAVLPILRWIVPIVLPRYEGYLYSNYWTITIGGIVVLWAFELLLVLVSWYKQFDKEHSYASSACMLIYLVLELMSTKLVLFGRIAWSFRAFLPLFFACTLENVDVKYRKWLKLILILLITVLFVRSAKSDTRNYTFLLENI